MRFNNHFAPGLKRFLSDIHANAVLEGKVNQKRIDPKCFIEALIRVLPTILRH